MPINEALHRILTRDYPDHTSDNESIREQHGRDESYHAPASPDLVIFPTSNQQVQDIVRRCAEYHTPIVPFGAGTSLEGHVAALEGGVCIDGLDGRHTGDQPCGSGCTC